MENRNFDEGDQRMIEIIGQHTSRINHIIEDILNISRGDETSRERIELKNWLPAFIDSFCQTGLASAESFQLEFESDFSTILFDAGQLNQILTNLCTNACVHADTSKPIIIRIYLDSDHALCIEIADQGPGISSDILDQIFEPFYTTSHQGSGLGLYIVAQLCELNNATIAAQINQYNGTSFILRISASSTDKDIE
jgi:two-component system sensor histidine kinase PilS (NtrC family)